MAANNREFFCQWSCLGESWALAGDASLIHRFGTMQKGGSPGCWVCSSPRHASVTTNLGDLSPRYVKYVWSVAADTGTDLESGWQSCQHLRSCRSVGSKQAGMFQHTQGQLRGCLCSPDSKPRLPLPWTGKFWAMTQLLCSWPCSDIKLHVHCNCL